MPQHAEGRSTSGCGAGAAARHAGSAARQDVKRGGRFSGGDGRCLSCEDRNGFATVFGKAPSYYLSHDGGRRTLVLQRRQGDRIRINDTTELMVLEIHLDQVEIALTSLPDRAARSQG
jgi:hypothetical protein